MIVWPLAAADSAIAFYSGTRSNRPYNSAARVLFAIIIVAFARLQSTIADWTHPELTFGDPP